MEILKRLSRNAGILVAAGLFSLAILFFVKNPNFFQASVLNAGEVNLIKANKRDIAYKQSTWLLDIFFSESIKDKWVTIVLTHNPLVNIDWWLFSWQCWFNIINSDLENITISLNCSNILTDQSALIIPFSGQIQDVLMEEWYYTDGGQKVGLSIWNLSEFAEHSN